VSTTFTLISDLQQERVIALRFAGEEGCTVRFAFPEVLLMHLKDVALIGENCETTTVGQLVANAKSLDFLDKDVAPRDHLGWGSRCARRHDRFQTERSQ
jgi:hypothetical protein